MEKFSRRKFQNPREKSQKIFQQGKILLNFLLKNQQEKFTRKNFFYFLLKSCSRIFYFLNFPAVEIFLNKKHYILGAGK